AADRAPRAWYPRFALGLVASAAGDRSEARRQLLAARSRNPRAALTVDAVRRVGSSRPLGFDEAHRRLQSELRIQRRQRR
ncbi:MAG: hypothetical protein M3N47_13405, partial [Chloroflexota bacterium]|nr:hypothetical protein [Chloroflexota bacterium]